MVIRDRGDFLRIDATDRVPVGVQGEGDTEFEIEVQVSAALKTEFHGKSWAWLEVDAIRLFVKELQAVLQDLKGSASVVSMSPNEFSLTIKPYDNARHLGVFGKLGHWCNSGPEGPYWSEINFGIQVEPGDLELLRQEFAKL